MLFYQTLAILCWSYIIAAFPLNGNIHHKRDVDPALVPPFGWQAGINPDGVGNCDGAVNGTNGKPIRVPCQCPPNSTFFLAALNKNVAAGSVTTNPTVKLTFPTDNSTDSQLARLNAAAVTLQNLEGPGIGCPVSSTTFSAQHKAISAESSNTTTTPSAPPTPSPSMQSSSHRSCPVTSRQSAPTTTTTTTTQTSSSAPPSPSSVTDSSATVPSSNATTPTDAQIAALAPSLGWQSGIDPDGTGNCDGAVNSTIGKPILIPCQCPPDQTHYISNLTANIRAGHVVLNPSILVTFLTDNSTASQNARLNAAAVTIQNLNGAGKGCPLSSTTFAAQSKIINGKS